MKTVFAAAAFALVLPGGATLNTAYKAGTGVRVEIESTIKLETTLMEIERDGEPVDMPGGGASTEATRTEVHVDRVVEAAQGRPTKVRRSFEEVGGKSAFSMGDNSGETPIESPLAGVTLEIVRDSEGEIETTVVEGTKPSQDGALENHVPGLFLDGLLPEGEIEEGAQWDLAKDAIHRAFRLDVERALYARPERPEGGGGEGGRGGRRGGMRGGDSSGMLALAEWTGHAKLVSLGEDVGGTTCAVIEIVAEASGEMPMPEMGGGRRRDRVSGAGIEAVLAENTYEIKLKGKLCFAVKAQRPLSFEVEGSLKNETLMERSMGESSMRIHTVREGTFEYKVAVSEAKAD